MNVDDVRVGFFLAVRYIRKASLWTTVLISFIIFLTFLNLTVIGGLLEGLIVGDFIGLRERALGDLYISPKEGKAFVERTQQIVAFLKDEPSVKNFSARRRTNVEIIPREEMYHVTNAREKRKTIHTTVLGIDPDAERMTTNLPSRIIEGSYFSEDNSNNEILIGSNLLTRYTPFGDDVLSGVAPGDFVYVKMISNKESDSSQEETSGMLKKYKVKGVHRTKASEMDFYVMMSNDEVRKYSSNPGNNVAGIAIRLFNPSDSTVVQSRLVSLGFDKYAKIETVEEAVGAVFDDLRTVFRMLGAVVGSIGLAVATITIFIIIFVAANARRKFIGILKAIGVTPNAIRISYVLYALFFAAVGTSIGLLVLFFLLVPYFDANPIPFPFSDGILYITPARAVFYTALLFCATFFSGLIPAHRIVRQPAINAVRGR